VASQPTEWHEFDYDRKEETKPPNDDPVWIVETLYEDGVTLGYFDGVTFCTWTGSDDCHVTHWAPITRPQAPEGALADG
jgi:hypothetical protein